MDTTAERGHGEARRDLGMKNYSVEKCYSAFFVKGIKVKLFKLQSPWRLFILFVHTISSPAFITQNRRSLKGSVR